MSQQSVEQILGKMLLDVEFRELMASDRSKALEGYNLTAEERKGFNNVDIDDMDQAFTSLDERVSKWWLLWTGGW